MKFGYVSMNSATGIHAAELAPELEARGYESMWVPEHTHIPISRISPFPSGIELPEGYYHMMNPFASLAAAGAVTSTLKLGTAVALFLQHSMINLAVETATLDVLTGGRLLLGAGVGWNAEELAGHRPDLPFKQRYSAMRERVSGLRALWDEDPVSFDGRWDQLEASVVQPKPVCGRIPILMGNWGNVGIRHVAEYADEWFPIDNMLLGPEGQSDVATGIARFRSQLEEFGRDPEKVPISLMLFGRPRADRIERYQELGVHRLVISAPNAELHSPDDTMRDLDAVRPILEPFNV
ncbi:TIGR03619 family F420-dependent LLM class oxidoreductase [Pseudomonadales bacterium]|jgi:probable F420-dependent oxidoreductase|nr:TIGR03619 family F420-dependent LLM class oxidoreductase [Pseudomonadales bacterium]|tara:strand:- start:1734 stop:2615 length:882 start_codon:yes stop_codon:yes gene_type:complete